MSWFSDLFKKKKVQSVPAYEGATSQLQLTGGQDLLNQLLARRGASSRLRDVYYNDIFQPTADYVRGTRNEQIINPILAQAGSMGMARSSKISDDLANRIAQQELGLAQYGGELKAKGFETGLGEEQFGTSGLANFVGNEANLNTNAANQKFRGGIINTEAINNFNQQPNPLVTAASMGLTTAGNISDILFQRRMLQQLQGLDPLQTLSLGRTTTGNYNPIYNV